MNARRIAEAAASYAPDPGQVATLVVLVVALVQESKALSWVVAALCVYGLAHELTRPEREHVYCPCDVCTTPTDTDGDDPR